MKASPDAFAELGSSARQRVVLTAAALVKTSEVADSLAAVEFAFDGTREGLKAVLPHLAHQTKSATLDCAATAAAVLETMAQPEIFDALFLGSVDGICLLRAGGLVVSVKNGAAARVSPPSARTVCIELADVRKEATLAALEDKSRRRDGAQVVILAYFAFAAVGMVSMAVGPALALAVRSRTRQ